MPDPGAGADTVWCGCYPEWEWVVAGILLVAVLCFVSFASFVIGCLFTRYIDNKTMFRRESILSAMVSSEPPRVSIPNTHRSRPDPGYTPAAPAVAGPVRIRNW